MPFPGDKTCKSSSRSYNQSCPRRAVAQFSGGEENCAVNLTNLLPEGEPMEHMTENDRIMIASFLDSGIEVKEIARMLNRNRTTICREIKGRRRMTVENRSAKPCPDLGRPPYVCNGCTRRNICRLTKYMYSAHIAQTLYRDKLRSSREGFNVTFQELEDMGRLVADGLDKGQSLHHIMASSPDRFTVCEKTVYRLVKKGMLPGAGYHNLLQAPCRKVKQRAKGPNEHKVEPRCREGRKYEDYLAFLKGNAGAKVVEMDSVIGRAGGKAILTMSFKGSGMMLAFVRERNDARSVKAVFDWLHETLGDGVFRRMFPVILTDNGSEFSAPSQIEIGPDGKRRTRVFYCHPRAAYEKGRVENGNGTLRRILVKGTSFDELTQEELNVIVSHANGLRRKEYGDRTAMEMFAEEFGPGTVFGLGLRAISDKDICLLPKLLKKIGVEDD